MLLLGWIVVGVAFVVVGEEVPLTYDPPSSCLSQNFTWSPATLSCVKCSAPNCRAGKCSEGAGWVDEPFQQGLCVPCGTLNPIDANTGTCTPCPSNHIQVVREVTGTLKKAIECVKCSDGFFPSNSGLSCVPCHPSFVAGGSGGCACPEVSHSEFGGICFPLANMSGEPTFDRKTAYKLRFEKSTVESNLLKEHLLASLYQCRDSLNLTACEVLTNLCVLDMGSYSSDEWNVCRLLRTLSLTRVPLPSYYIEAAPSLLAGADAIPHIHTTRYSLMNISVTQWTLNGTFLGLADLEDVLPCSMPKKLIRMGRHFGTNFRVECDIDLTNPAVTHRLEFIHPFLSYNDGSLKKGQSLLYPIPLKVLNLSKSGKKVNQGDDQFSWQLVRRFFIVDASSTSSREDRSPRVLRYLKSLNLKVTLQNSQEAGKIYVPLLTATYGELNAAELDKRKTVPFEYSVTYSMDMSRALEDVKISVGVLSSLAVLWGAIETWAWTRRNGRLDLDFRTLFTFLSSCAGNLADAFAVVCLSTGTFWLVFYKKQAAVHVFLPERFQEKLIRDLLISAFALKIVEIAQLLHRQCTVSLFLIDWERPKAPAHVIPVPTTASSKSANNNSTSPNTEVISIWRTYFIANEWNELQTFRKTHVPSQLLASLALLEVLGFKWIALHTTQSEDYAESYELLSTTVPFSTVARIVVGTGVYLGVGIFQWIFRRLTWHSSHPLNAFVDLCSLANVSVWGMSARLHGFYIHGRSVHGFADTDMGTMVEQLAREEEDLCGRRGLVPQTDTQTFTISIPVAFRSVYDALLPVDPPPGVIIPKGVFGTGRNNRRMPPNASANVSSVSLTARLNSYGSLTRFLCAFLDHALSDLDYEVVNKSILEQTLRIELNDLPPDRAFFYTDDSGHSSFDSVLFFGHERSLFLFNLYCFLFMDMMTHNYVMAASFVLLLDLIVAAIRNTWGKSNLARKTLIDRRFLI